ncbi:glycosyltransferase [Candidatus Microgenomates bacterium]|nr:glycosyltransferase [Candidatus Microgenomates bacterium]
MKERYEYDNRGKAAIDYSQYSQLHIEDSPRKIAELIAVVPSAFIGRRMLDVGADAGIITSAIGKQIGAKDVQAIEPSAVALPLVQENLQGFEQHAVYQTDFEQFVPSVLFDLTMFIDVLEHVTDPVELLKKASQYSRFAAVRIPLEDSIAVQVHQQLYGEDIQALMEKRYGHIHHFNRRAVREMVDKGGFDIIRERATRIPSQASILDRPLSKAAESASWNLANRYYPELWGGFYLAFLKSRNVEVIDPKIATLVHEALLEEFGEDNLLSVGVFGSTAREADHKHSDYDFIVIVNDLPSDVHEREQASPRMKRRLRDKGVDELCAFNLYTAEEFKQASERKSWLIESMKVGYRVLYDKGFLADILDAQQPQIERVGSLAWRGVDYEDGYHLQSVIERHNRVAEVIRNIDPQLVSYHEREATRGELIGNLYEHGEYNTRSSLLMLAKRLNYQYGEALDLSIIQMDDYLQEVEGNEALFEYDIVDRHLKIAKVLEENGMPLDALFHTYSALRNIYLYALHSNDQYIADGEVTQLFLREFSGKISPELGDLIYANSFKAEQILGRSGYVSFDLDREGKPIYENPEISPVDYASLMLNLRNIIGYLQGNNEIGPVQVYQFRSTISVVVATYNRYESLVNCIRGLNKLIIPKGKVELIIVDDGSAQNYDVAMLHNISELPVKYIKKEHSGICATKNRGIEESSGDYVAFLDDDMIVSPLWLTQLMSGFKNDRIAGVGSTNLTYPDKNTFTQYSDYRELARKAFRDETGEILNVLTGTAVFRKDVLVEVGGFNIRQSVTGVPFGGDDVDLTWRIRNQGYQLRHVEGAVAFHNHRGSLRGLIKQHIGYGEGTMFHCIDSGRNPAELGIPEPTYSSVAKDIFHYISREVPKRIWEVYRNHLGLKKALQYPLLDLTRRVCYDVGVLKAKRFKDLIHG